MAWGEFTSINHCIKHCIFQFFFIYMLINNCSLLILNLKQVKIQTDNVLKSLIFLSPNKLLSQVEHFFALNKLHEKFHTTCSYLLAFKNNSNLGCCWVFFFPIIFEKELLKFLQFPSTLLSDKK